MRELTYHPLLEPYPITSGYGYRTDPITGAQGKFHRGVDYGCPYGVPLIAPYDGQITTGYESGGAGYWIWCVNGGDMFKSFHHSSYAVSGGWVEAGTVIAYIGSTGSSTGAHAHLELWENGVNIDPTGYLNRAPIKGQDDEMTEDDWARMEGIINGAVNNAMKSSYTGARALGVPGQPGVYYILDTDEGPKRFHIGSPDQVKMLQWTDHIAGSGDGATRHITDPAFQREFLNLPLAGPSADPAAGPQKETGELTGYDR